MNTPIQLAHLAPDITAVCDDPRAEAAELRALSAQHSQMIGDAVEVWHPAIDGRAPSRGPLVGWAEPAYSDVEQALFALHRQLDTDAAARLARRTSDGWAYLQHLTAAHAIDGRPGDTHRFGPAVRAFRAESARLMLRTTALTGWLNDNWDSAERRPHADAAFGLDPYLKLLLTQHRVRIGPDGPDKAIRAALAAEARALTTDSHRMSAWAQVTATWLEEISRRRAAGEPTTTFRPDLTDR